MPAASHRPSHLTAFSCSSAEARHRGRRRSSTFPRDRSGSTPSVAAAAWLCAWCTVLRSSVCVCARPGRSDGALRVRHLRPRARLAVGLRVDPPSGCGRTSPLACASATPSTLPHDDFDAGFVNAFVALYAATGLASPRCSAARSSRTRSSRSSSTTSGRGVAASAACASSVCSRHRRLDACCAAAFGRCSSSCSARRGPARGPPPGCGRTARSRSSATAVRTAFQQID